MQHHRTDYVIDTQAGCWVWQKALKGTKGYGLKKVAGRVVSAHRWYYEQAKGPIPEGLTLDHLCRNRACVNPAHLEPVTNAENVRRGLSAKLTREAVRAIRTSTASNGELARRFGVAKNTISQVRTQARWRET